jgi:4a-hydroxytetrahydrobiopterin dehydratase
MGGTMSREPGEKLSAAERRAALELLPEWREAGDRDAITRSFEFADFGAAFGWMTRVALLAEKMDHHPDWTNSWRKVSVTLTTHSASGVTSRDIELAAAMDRLAAESGARSR